MNSLLLQLQGYPDVAPDFFLTDPHVSILAHKSTPQKFLYFEVLWKGTVSVFPLVRPNAERSGGDEQDHWERLPEYYKSHLMQLYCQTHGFVIQFFKIDCSSLIPCFVITVANSSHGQSTLLLGFHTDSGECQQQQ